MPELRGNPDYSGNNEATDAPGKILAPQQMGQFAHSRLVIVPAVTFDGLRRNKQAQSGR
jgi:hypothetical protein